MKLSVLVLLLIVCVLVLNVMVLIEIIKMLKRIHPLGIMSTKKSQDGFKLTTQQRFVILVMATSLTTITCNLPYTVRMYLI